MNDKVNLRLGALLRQCRVDRGVSQRELAQRSAVPDTRLSAIERGRVVGPGRGFVERVCAALKLPQAERARLLQAATHDRCLREVDQCFEDPARIELVARAFDAAGLLHVEDCQELADLLDEQVRAREVLRKARRRKEVAD